MTEQIRIDEPGFVARYREARQAAPPTIADPTTDADDPGEPGYLRSYRARTAGEPVPAGTRSDGVAEAGGASTRPRTHRSNGTTAAELANDVFLVRHGEVDAFDELGGLSEPGVWQAHSYGRRISTEFRDGERAVIRHAGSPRAAETAANIAAGLAEACAESGRSVEIDAPAAMDAFANFRFAGPTGPVDISEAFRCHLDAEDAWRTDPAEPPLWAFELERFWNLQIAGGDPVELWLTTPSIHAEPAAMVVRRVWSGIRRLGDDHPGARLIIATHGGVVRAFAIAALGYDPGDPYNAEHVRAKILAGRDDAVVSYRNRHQEISVPDIADLPVWKTRETWQPRPRAAAL